MAEHPFVVPPLAISQNSEGTGRDDLFSGFGGDDIFSGSGGDDVFFEGWLQWSYDPVGPFETDEVYFMGAGSDRFDGGDGVDIVSYAGVSQTLTLNFKAATIALGPDLDSFQRVEGFVLGDGADRIVGVARLSAFDAGGGFDTLDLRGEVDALAITLDEGVDYLTTSEGVVMGVFSVEAVYGSLTASTRFQGNAETNWFWGGRRSDTFVHSAGGDSYFGGDGNDSFEVSAGAKSAELANVYGGSGIDFLYLNAWNVEIDLAVGLEYSVGVVAAEFASIENVRTAGGADRVVAAEGSRILTEAGRDEVIAAPLSEVYLMSGDDRVAGDFSGASLFGGEGDDVLDASAASAGLSLDLGADPHGSLGGAAEVSGFEIFIGAGAYANTMVGGAGHDTLIGGNLSDVLAGNDAQDNLRGANGNDRLYGGGDNDLIYGGNGEDFLVSGAGYYGWPHVRDENVLFGGAGDDRLVGQGRLEGGIGNDVLIAEGGAASLMGGDGDDRIDLRRSIGGEAQAYGGVGDDTIFYAATAGWVTMDGGDGFDTLVFGGRLAGSDYDVERMFGSDGDDDLEHDSSFQDQIVRLGAGNDRYISDWGEHRVFLEAGDDFGHGRDVALFGGDGADVLQLDGAGLLSGGDGDDVLIAAVRPRYSTDPAVPWGTDSLGGAGNDRIDIEGTIGHHDGGTGDDSFVYGRINLEDGRKIERPGTATLAGGLGNDSFDVRAEFAEIDMGAGSDIFLLSFHNTKRTVVVEGTVHGGSGADRFDFHDTAARGRVVIADFDPRVDRLSFANIDRMEEFDRVEETRAGVTLVMLQAEGEVRVTLTGLTYADLSDAILA